MIIAAILDSDMNFPISYRAAQVAFCVLFRCAGSDDTPKRIRKRLPIRNIRHGPPPPPPRQRSSAGQAGRRW